MITQNKLVTWLLLDINKCQNIPKSFKNVSNHSSSQTYYIKQTTEPHSLPTYTPQLLPDTTSEVTFSLWREEELLLLPCCSYSHGISICPWEPECLQASPACPSSVGSLARGDHGKLSPRFVMESEWNRKLIVEELNMKMNVYVRLAMHAPIMGEW